MLGISCCTVGMDWTFWLQQVQHFDEGPEAVSELGVVAIAKGYLCMLNACYPRDQAAAVATDLHLI